MGRHLLTRGRLDYGPDSATKRLRAIDAGYDRKDND